MFVILTQDLPQMGAKNTLHDVSDGYYANFLAPRKLAMRATTEMIESLKQKLLEEKKREAQFEQNAHEYMDKLTSVVLTLSAKASDKGTLFQALVESDIVEAIKNQCDISLKPEYVQMEHIKKIGEHTVDIKIGSETARVIVFVEASKEK